MNRQNKANCSWNELENYKTAQEESMKHVFEEVEGDLRCCLHRWFRLMNPGPTGVGAVIYLNGLQSDPIGIREEFVQMEITS